MSVQAGDIAPDFEQDTINGSIRFHQWMGRSWCLLFGRSLGDFAAASRVKPELARRGVKVVGLRVDAPCADDADDGVDFPVVADADRSVAALYGMTGPEPDSSAADPAVLRRVCLIDPDKRIRLLRTYPGAGPLDFDGLLLDIDALQGALPQGAPSPARSAS